MCSMSVIVPSGFLRRLRLVRFDRRLGAFPGAGSATGCSVLVGVRRSAPGPARSVDQGPGVAQPSAGVLLRLVGLLLLQLVELALQVGDLLVGRGGRGRRGWRGRDLLRLDRLGVLVRGALVAREVL